MDIESYYKNSYQIIKIRANSFIDADFSKLYKLIEGHLTNGRVNVAIFFNPNSYPYSKLISFLVHCIHSIEEYGGTLAVIQPSEEFLQILKTINLDNIIKIFPSENDITS